MIIFQILFFQTGITKKVPRFAHGLEIINLGFSHNFPEFNIDVSKL